MTVQGTEAVEVPVEFVKVEGSSFTELEGIAKLMDGEGGIAFNFDTSHDSRFFTFPVRPLELLRTLTKDRLRNAVR